MAGRRIQSSSSSDSDTARSRSPSTRRRRRSRSSRQRGRTPTSRGRGRSPASRGRDRSPGRRRYSRSVRRTRSRSTSRVRSRSPRHIRSRSSPSPPPNQRTHGPRLPPAGPPPDPTQLFKQMKDLVLEQFQEVSQTIADQKEELEEKFTKSTVKFAQKPLEKQFEVNANILALNHKIQKALRKKI